MSATGPAGATPGPPKPWETEDFQKLFKKEYEAGNTTADITVQESKQVEYVEGIKGVHLTVKVRIGGKERTLSVYSGNKEVVEQLLGKVPDQTAAEKFLKGCIPILAEMAKDTTIQSVSQNPDKGELTIDKKTYRCDTAGISQMRALLNPPNGWKFGDSIAEHPKHKSLNKEIERLKEQIRDHDEQIQKAKGGWFTNDSEVESLERKKQDLEVQLDSKEKELNNLEPRINMMATAEKLAIATKPFFDYEKAASETTPEYIKDTQDNLTDVEVKTAASKFNPNKLLTNSDAFVALNATQMEGVNWNALERARLDNFNIVDMMKKSGIDKPEDPTQKEKVQEFAEKMSVLLSNCSLNEVEKIFQHSLPKNYATALFNHLDYTKLRLEIIEELSKSKDFSPKTIQISDNTLFGGTTTVTRSGTLDDQITKFKALMISLDAKWSSGSLTHPPKTVKDTFDLSRISNEQRAKIILDQQHPPLSKDHHALLLADTELTVEELKAVMQGVDVSKVTDQQKDAIKTWLRKLTENLTDDDTIDKLIAIKDHEINHLLLENIREKVKYNEVRAKLTPPTPPPYLTFDEQPLTILSEIDRDHDNLTEHINTLKPYQIAKIDWKDDLIDEIQVDKLKERVNKVEFLKAAAVKRINSLDTPEKVIEELKKTEYTQPIPDEIAKALAKKIQNYLTKENLMVDDNKNAISKINNRFIKNIVSEMLGSNKKGYRSYLSTPAPPRNGFDIPNLQKLAGK